MTLSSFNPFSCIEAALFAPAPRSLDRLRVDDRSRGTGVASSLDPCYAPQSVVQPLEEAVLLPRSEVVVYRRPRGELPRQHAPLAAGLDQVEHGIQDVAAKIVFASALPVEERFDKLPLGVRQVGAIALMHGSDKSR